MSVKHPPFLSIPVAVHTNTPSLCSLSLRALEGKPDVQFHPFHILFHSHVYRFQDKILFKTGHYLLTLMLFRSAVIFYVEHNCKTALFFIKLSSSKKCHETPHEPHMTQRQTGIQCMNMDFNGSSKTDMVKVNYCGLEKSHVHNLPIFSFVFHRKNDNGRVWNHMG